MHRHALIFKFLLVVVLIALGLSACSPATPVSSSASSGQPSTGLGNDADPLASLETACKAEGGLNLIATPRSWANYGEIFDLFEKMSGAKINSVNEDAGSADELAAVEASKTAKSPDAPDIVDVGYAFGKTGKDAGDYQPYKVSSWDRIPETILGVPSKDPDGYWIGGYFGVMALEVNTAVVKDVPQNWSDLLKPEYKNQVALAGDPRKSNEAIQSVYAAAFGNGGSLDNAQPGLEFFKQLNTAGNFVPVIANSDTVSKGTTPISLSWDYLAFGDRDSFAGNPSITVVYPRPTIASMYVQAISAYAPHVNCAKLWMELLHSDPGQLAWMTGYAHGVSEFDMRARGAIPPDLQAKLPASSAYASAVSPTSDQLAAAKQLITTDWDKVVGVDVK